MICKTLYLACKWINRNFDTFARKKNNHLRNCTKTDKNLFDDQIFWKKMKKKKIYNMINNIIDLTININLSVNFHTERFLFRAMKTINKRHNNFSSYEFIIDKYDIFDFKIKNNIEKSIFIFKFFFKELWRKITILLIKISLLIYVFST